MNTDADFTSLLATPAVTLRVAFLLPSRIPAGWMARGFALGTAAHGIGAARALQVNADAGAYAGLALGLQVLLASLLMPLAFRLF